MRNDPRPKLVFKESETARRKEYNFVEALQSLEHQLTRDDLKKAYQIAGQKFLGAYVLSLFFTSVSRAFRCVVFISG